MFQKKSGYVWAPPGCNGLEIEMVYVPAGYFIMGDNGSDYLKPKHIRSVKDGFFMAKYPTTWEQYMLFCEHTGHKKPTLPAWGMIPDHPVVCVTWDDAKAFCKWAGMALPEEAEWEKACRGTDGREYPWGNEQPTRELCVYSRNQTDSIYSCPNGASPYGAMHMAGNVWEWCEDVYDDKAYYKYVESVEIVTPESFNPKKTD